MIYNTTAKWMNLFGLDLAAKYPNKSLIKKKKEKDYQGYKDGIKVPNFTISFSVFAEV